MDRLHDALEDNSFSSINTGDLPLSTTLIATTVAGSPKAMTAEAMSFAIMARNVALVWKIKFTVNNENIDLSGIYPYHLAASYLDGSSACCEIFHPLMTLVRENVIKRLYVNDLGHTVLDSLMITVLKGHTSCTPIMVDKRWTSTKRFPGEDIDICGRWDADSPCLRALNSRGSPRIPLSWKHMFCHTSVQAVCHAIDRIFSATHAPDINTPSGLFTETCFTCGNKLTPGPIHTLILTAVILAQNGCDGENLFGMLACLVCMLLNGADPTAKADLSASALLGAGEQQECSHEPLDPLELGEKVPAQVRDSWTPEVKVGWECIMAVLRFVQPKRSQRSAVVRPNEGLDDEWSDYVQFSSPQDPTLFEDGKDGDEDDDEYEFDECDEHYGYVGRHANKRHVRVLWSAIKTELVSYRRLEEKDPWLSDNFKLAIVRDGANARVGFSGLPLVCKGMMKPTCRCGEILETGHKYINTTDECCSYYFSNMDDYQRSTYQAIED
jgi:hypothetical protein